MRGISLDALLTGPFNEERDLYYDAVMIELLFLSESSFSLYQSLFFFESSGVWGGWMRGGRMIVCRMDRGEE